MQIEKKIENMRLMLYEGYRKGISAQEMLALSQKLDDYIAEYYRETQDETAETQRQLSVSHLNV